MILSTGKDVEDSIKYGRYEDLIEFGIAGEILGKWR